MAIINVFLRGNTPIVKVEVLNSGAWVVVIKAPDDEVNLFFKTERNVAEFKKAVEAI